LLIFKTGSSFYKRLPVFRLLFNITVADVIDRWVTSNVFLRDRGMLCRILQVHALYMRYAYHLTYLTYWMLCVVVNCPVDNIKLSVVVSNLAVAEQIGELLVHCRYGVEPTLKDGIDAAAADNCELYQVNPYGCPVTMRASARRYVYFLLIPAHDMLSDHVAYHAVSCRDVSYMPGTGVRRNYPVLGNSINLEPLAKWTLPTGKV